MAKKKKISSDMYALMRELIQESLRDWFKKEDWVRIASDGSIAGPCGTSKNKKNPDRCLPKAKAQSLTKGQRAATAAKKKKAGAKGKTVVPNTKKAKVTREQIFELVVDAISERNNLNFKDLLNQTEKEALKLVHKNWDKFDGKTCNSGFCDIFAQKFHKRFPDSEIFSTEAEHKTLGHVWVKYKGKYYDAETPEGVNDWKELPWMISYNKEYETYPQDIKQLKENTHQAILEKDDRCTRIAKQKYDTWPSAYASGAVVRCRRGEIWKDI
jgi:hypothetical protein